MTARFALACVAIGALAGCLLTRSWTGAVLAGMALGCAALSGAKEGA